MAIPKLRILVAVDAEHLEELRVVWPTWRRRPEIMDKANDLNIICDTSKIPGRLHIPIESWQWLLDFILDDKEQASLIEWDWRPGLPQRERMLTALVKAGDCSYPDDSYILKLDTDCVSVGSGPWIQEEWFEGFPSIAAPRWNYTRPGSMIADFNKWADERFIGGKPIEHEIRGGIARHQRIISYCSFVRTKFAKLAAELAGERLPVPSHDTYLFCLAQYIGWKVRFINVKERGWRHVGGGGLRRLKQVAEEALANG